MKRLSFVEIIAVLFTGIAGLASAAQAYVSWETRGEVSRAIVFSERIDACAKIMAAIDPFVAKARSGERAALVSGGSSERYSLPRYYYGQSSGNSAFDAEHNPRLESWRVAAAAFRIVSPDGADDQIGFFDRVITTEIEQGRFMSQSELVTWLERLEAKSEELTKICRGLL